MRTTLTIDDDLAHKLRRLAERRRTSFKDVVNAVLRRGLGAQERTVARVARFRVDTFRSGFRAGVDPHRLNQLVDDLEVRHHTERPG